MLPLRTLNRDYIRDFSWSHRCAPHDRGPSLYEGMVREYCCNANGGKRKADKYFKLHASDAGCLER